MKFPGIIFADGPAGRRARIAGTGIEVREVIASFRNVGRSFARLKKAYHWLSEPQLRSALGYHAAHPEEIDRQLARDVAWTKRSLAKRYPRLAL